LIHEIASAFQGHPRIKKLYCGSDHLIPRIFQNSPQLEQLYLPFVHNWAVEQHNDLDMEDDEGSGMMDDEPELSQENSHATAGGQNSLTRRNLGAILRLGRQLKVIELEAPTFWRRKARTVDDAEDYAIEILRLNSITGWSIENFVHWLNGPTGARLGNLRELKLDVD
jgi:hypothetical protein